MPEQIEKIGDNKIRIRIPRDDRFVEMTQEQVKEDIVIAEAELTKLKARLAVFDMEIIE